MGGGDGVICFNDYSFDCWPYPILWILKSRKFRVPAIFTLGLLFLALSQNTLGNHHHEHSEGVGTLHFFATLAGFSLALGHWP